MGRAFTPRGKGSGMSSKAQGTTWQADPHTIAKIAILKAYLNAWFPILGRSKPGQPILYVDGFAGPGEYRNFPEGSPVAALASAQNSINASGSQWLAGMVHCVFIEEDAARCDNLTQRLRSVPVHPKVETLVLNKTFIEGMHHLQATMPQFFRRGYPLFVFIDPFGATGVPFSTLAGILQSPCSEVLINLDADGIARILLAEGHADHERLLTGLFGDDSWKTQLTAHAPFPLLCRQVFDLYKSKLRSISNVRYAFPFEMRDKKNALSYYLVFASQEPLGLAKMKEAMRSIDKTGSYSFSDGALGQETLFRFDDPKEFATALHARFLGSDVPASELRDFALNETPFTNAKSMLRVLEQRGCLEVTSSNPKRRRGDFSEDTLISVRFLPEHQAPEHAQGRLF